MKATASGLGREEQTAAARTAFHPSLLTPQGSLPIKRYGLIEYHPIYEAMRRYTETRDAASPDELWLVQHPPVYTVGMAGREAHFPRAGSIPLSIPHSIPHLIPLVRIDRGGQITYHGPGQAVLYTLLDLARRGLTVRSLVRLLEQAVIDCLAAHDVEAMRRPDAPGVYVDGAKVAALGLRVRRGCCYHGVALNVDMDLTPFAAIDPCGYPGLAVTQTRALGIAAGVDAMGEALARRTSELLEAQHDRR
jgi:lipoyl(octanoyl) transferase